MNQDKSPEDPEDTKRPETKSSNDFVTPSILLFLDSLLVSVGGWLYWLVISKLTLASEIGLAVTVYSLVILATTLTQLDIYLRHSLLAMPNLYNVIQSVHETSKHRYK